MILVVIAVLSVFSWYSVVLPGVRPRLYDVLERNSAVVPQRQDVNQASSRSQHPIQTLAEKAIFDFQATIDRQSRTLDAAVAQYRIRYRRSPPPGFARWFTFAQRHHSRIIDDYDSIAKAMEPFWQQSPARSKELVEQVSERGSLHAFSVSNGTFDFGEDNWMGEEIARTLADVVQDLPELQLITNSLDEPMVVSPATETKQHVQLFDDGNAQPSWAVISGSCRDAPKQVQPYQTGPSTFPGGLPFVANTAEMRDLCRHPEYEHMHGFFVSPTSLEYTTENIPIWSQAAPSTFRDIVYPSPWYWTHIDEELEERDVPWQSKTNDLYWAGTTTGGHSAHSRWNQHHRQRFIATTSQLLNKSVTFLTESTPGHWQTYQSRDILAQLYNTKFTGLSQCDDVECEAQAAYFHVGKSEPFQNAYKSRFVMDVDGNSFSGRYYNLLSSQSVVLKQTIFREWHDERLFPWLHYVPVSLQMEELPEIMRYLALTKDGGVIAKTIADKSRAWARTALRREDAAVYMYRLLLEYARVMSDDREDD